MSSPMGSTGSKRKAPTATTAADIVKMRPRSKKGRVPEEAFPPAARGSFPPEDLAGRKKSSKPAAQPAAQPAAKSAAKSAAKPAPLGYEEGGRFVVRFRGGEYDATIMEASSNGKYLIRYDKGDTEERNVPASRILREIADDENEEARAEFEEGDRVMVQYGVEELLATVVEVRGGMYDVRYDEDSNHEWVPANRILEKIVKDEEGSDDEDDEDYISEESEQLPPVPKRGASRKAGARSNGKGGKRKGCKVGDDEEEEEGRIEKKARNAPKDDVSAKGPGAGAPQPGGGGDAGPEGGGEGGEDPSQGPQGVVELSTTGEDGGEVTSAGNEEGPLLVAAKAVGAALGEAAKGAMQWFGAMMDRSRSNSASNDETVDEVDNLEYQQTTSGENNVFVEDGAAPSFSTPARAKGSKVVFEAVDCAGGIAKCRVYLVNVREITLATIRNELKQGRLGTEDFVFLQGGAEIVVAQEKRLDTKASHFGLEGKGLPTNPYRLTIKITSR